MSGVLQDAETAEFLKTRWSNATAYQQREISYAISEFMRENGIEDIDDATDDELLDAVAELVDDVGGLISEVESLKRAARDIQEQLKPKK